MQKGEGKESVEYKLQLLDSRLVRMKREEILSLMAELTGEDQVQRAGESILIKYESMLRFLADGSAKIVGAFRQEELVAYAWGYYRKETRRIHITQLVVSQTCRRKGIGILLLEKMEELTGGSNCEGLELNVKGKNDSARYFYYRYGFCCDHLFLTKNIHRLKQIPEFLRGGEIQICS